MNNQEPKTKLCLLRDIYRSIRDFELQFQEKYNLCLNEGMVLCSLKTSKMSSSDLADKLGLSASNMSKVIKFMEEKNMLKRSLGKNDKRQMYFELSKQGEEKLNQIAIEESSIDSILNSIYATQELEIIGFTNKLD